MVTASAEMCYCGEGLTYIGPNKDTLHCPHCDEPCLIQEKTKKICGNCHRRNKFWEEQINNG